MTETSHDPITPYDRLAWTDQQVEHLLASGQRRRELVAAFGAELYGELAALARTAQAVNAAAGPRVWLVPGIMGSRLGRLRAGGEADDTLWLDPFDIIAGRLRELRVLAGSDVRSLGIMHYSYLKLKLQIAAGGYAVRSFDYDWRHGVVPLGAQFAASLREDARDCMIVAHSMGGLVVRAALSAGGLPRVQRLLLVGTPNNGSWGAAQALRGTYSVVRRLAQLDRVNDADTLAANTFQSFQSLHDLLPGVASADHRLLTMDAWPTTGLRPDPESLRAAAGVAASLILGDERCICIAGYGEATVLDARAGEQFTYTIGSDGDGTVSLAAAQLAGVRCYFARCSHSMLTRDAAVAAAVIELLRTGITARLPDSWQYSRVNWSVTDAQLRAAPQPRLDWAAMSIDERRIFLDSLNQPLPLQT